MTLFKATPFTIRGLLLRQFEKYSGSNLAESFTSPVKDFPLPGFMAGIDTLSAAFSEQPYNLLFN
ncbi:MAG: hypothetical protein HYZ44_08545 [Bacteroidetes bacterium]|nr:hypothetical protein [Bacteroidota bacterium]